ncbi:MAG: 2-C-methyl-D-erythritol 4-phosphate cytidylyltransferase [Lachnospiraceae bacterium]|nr:2-C-methyl-D-erythritol 4-phosphate cytidylyltransferase [Lachnospiraceae bacterium]MCI9018261.1 2-C-methyl-D-erythritol 4-phosphate cytidylyltransferase [Lachnospiraceae bacterium]
MGKRGKHCTAIVLAAGQGRRMGGNVSKQYLELAGKPIIYYTLEAFQNSPLIDSIILVTGPEQMAWCKEELVHKYNLTKVDTITTGGSERYISVWNGLQVIEDDMTQADREGIVFIHDGVRPFIDAGILSRTMEAAYLYGACVAAMPVKETIKIADENGFVESTPARNRVWGIQTPQVFDFRLAYGAYQAAMESGRTDMTDDAMIVESFTDVKVKLVEGSYENIKITTPEDLEIAEVFLRKRKKLKKA